MQEGEKQRVMMLKSWEMMRFRAYKKAIFKKKTLENFPELVKDTKSPDLEKLNEFQTQ